MATHVADGDAEAAVGERDEVVVIAADGVGRVRRPARVDAEAGGADLHAGELRRVGGKKPLLNPPGDGEFGGGARQLGLGLLAGGDIPVQTLHTDHLAARIDERRLEHLHVGAFAIGVLVFLDAFEDLARLQHPAIVIGIFLCQLVRIEVAVGLADDHLARLLERDAEGAIAEDEPSLRILAEDCAPAGYRRVTGTAPRIPRAPAGAGAIVRALPEAGRWSR